MNEIPRYSAIERLVVVGVCVGLMFGSVACALRIDADYPGGNVIVEKIEGGTAYLRPDLRDTGTWWFYWNFDVEAVGGRELGFKFSGNNPIGTRGPACSVDGGRSWRYLGATNGPAFSYTMPADTSQVRFAFAIPYLESDLDLFLENYKNNAHLRVDTLCRSRKDRAVERLRLGKLRGEPDYRVLLTARHHACESIASYALEGLIGEVLTGDDSWLRDNVEILAIPFVDKDGVQDGDQGKNRKPYDHNRDYLGRSIYPETAAIRAQVDQWSEGKLAAFLDLHCPYIRGSGNEAIYMVGVADPRVWAQQSSFGRILEESQQGPLQYRVADNLPFGQGWNTAANYKDGKSSSRWAGELPGIELSATIEIPYANVGEQLVTAAAARAFGRDLARALTLYLQQLDQQEK